MSIEQLKKDGWFDIISFVGDSSKFKVGNIVSINNDGYYKIIRIVSESEVQIVQLNIFEVLFFKLKKWLRRLK